MYFYCYDYVFSMCVYVWLPWLRFFRVFSSVVRQKCQGDARKDGARPALFLIFVCSMYFLCCSTYCLFCVILYIVCVYMCTKLLPPNGYPIAVKYIISLYHICRSFPQSLLVFSTSVLIQDTNTYRRLHRDSYHTFWWYFFYERWFGIDVGKVEACCKIMVRHLH
jgi:hypothetical protein